MYSNETEIRKNSVSYFPFIKSFILAAIGRQVHWGACIKHRLLIDELFQSDHKED